MVRAWAAAVALTAVASACASGDGPACAPPAALGSSEPIARSAAPAVEVRALAAGATLFVRATFGLSLPSHLLFVDADADRSSGMWTYQSPVSAAGWDLLVDGGRLHAHTGGPSQWSWTPSGAPGFARSAGRGRVDVCIPAGALGFDARDARVALMVGDGGWVPAAFLEGAGLQRAALAAPAGPRPPGPLAIHYSATPSRVRGCADETCAAGVFGAFAHVVLSAGLEHPGHRHHAETARLTGRLRAAHPATELWGYVSLIGTAVRADGGRDVVYEVDDIVERALAWQSMGATGVFLDEAGACTPAPGCVATRARLEAVVGAVHGLGMAVFVNAFSAVDVLGPAGGRPSPLGGASASRPADMYLLENAFVSGGSVVSGLDAAVTDAKLVHALRAREETGVRVAAVDTLAGAVPDSVRSDRRYAIGYGRASAAGLDAYGFANASFSADPSVDANLALPAPPTVPTMGSSPLTPGAEE